MVQCTSCGGHSWASLPFVMPGTRLASLLHAYSFPFVASCRLWGTRAQRLLAGHATCHPRAAPVKAEALIVRPPLQVCRALNDCTLKATCGAKECAQAREGARACTHTHLRPYAHLPQVPATQQEGATPMEEDTPAAAGAAAPEAEAPK